ncbi:MAG: class I SAM-dependent methyltransferase [Rhodothermales bacterium]
MKEKSMPIENLKIEKFEEFLSEHNTPMFRESVERATGWPREEVNRQFAVYFNEMSFGFKFVLENIVHSDRTILEVGAGLGFLSLFLAKAGYRVIAIEPSAEGFPLFRHTLDYTANIAQKEGLEIRFLPIGAEALASHGVSGIDFAYSVNVVEHIEKLDEAFAAVIAALRPTGRWCNSCPNYSIPYEPHFGIPLVPFFPSLSRRIFFRKVQKDMELWRSLNFVTASRVRSLSDRYDADATFEKAVMWNSMRRFIDDPGFAARHKSGIVGKIFSVLTTTKTIDFLKFLPPNMATPMHFTVRPRAGGTPKT